MMASMLGMAYQWQWDVIADKAGELGSAFLVTIILSIVACVIGMIVAIPMALALGHPWPEVRWPVRVIVEVGKGVPLLVLLVWCHWVLPITFGFRTSAFWNAIIAFTLNFAAFASDVMRGHIAMIPPGHIEAAQALGMSRTSVLRRVIIPETIKRSWPGLVALFIGVFKLSTLASAVGVGELLYVTRVINSDTPRPFELYTTIAVAFFVCVVGMSWLARRLENHPCLILVPKIGK